MPKLNALNTQQTEVDMANAPEQFGDYAPPPQPGRNYVFALPRFTADQDWNEYDAAEGVRRLALQFGGRKEGAVPPLVVLESPTGKHVGDPVNTRITNEERKFERNKDMSAVSPMHYLMVAVGVDPSGWSNVDFANGLIKHSNGKFRARVIWTAQCNPKNNIYMWDEAQGKSVEQEGVPGCATRWGLTERKNAKGETTYAIPHSDEEGREHEYANKFTCHCGASLQAFVELQNFKAYDDVEGAEVAEVVEAAPPAPAPAPVKAAPAPAQAAPKAAAPKPNGGVAATAKPSQTPVAARPQAAGGPPKPSAPRPAAAPAKK